MFFKCGYICHLEPRLKRGNNPHNFFLNLYIAAFLNAAIVFFFFFLSRPDGECIYKCYYKFYKCYYKKPITHTIPACYSCKILACCMQQNNKPEFQRNIKLEFSQTCHDFNQSLRNMGKLSIFKEYAVQYSNKMEESLGSI